MFFEVFSYIATHYVRMWSQQACFIENAYEYAKFSACNIEETHPMGLIICAYTVRYLLVYTRKYL